MKKSSRFTFYFLLLLAPFAAFDVHGQQEKGDVQMQASVSLSSTSSNGVSSTSYTAQYATSKFFTKHTELGFAFILGGGSSFSYNYLSPFLNYNLLSKDGKFVFYMGAQYLFSTSKSGSVETVSGGVGAKAGIRSYVSNNVFYFVGPNLTFMPKGVTQFDLTAGIGVLFKKNKPTDQ
jgi:hypothetical protein